MQTMAPRFTGFITDFFVYQTSKSVVVKSWSVGIINRIAQLLIIMYFICWVFLHEKAYQDRDTGIEFAVMTKVKGLGTLNNQVTDVADYVAPPQGSSSFCIITRMIVTANQTQGYCPESDEKFSCDTDDYCIKQKESHLANGFITGRCLNSTSSDVNNTSGWCEIQGWCPAENDKLEANTMNEVENFTVFIKNSIRFPRFNVTRGNFDSTINKSYIQTCIYEPVNHPHCPIFKVGDILKHINQTSITHTGGEIGINIAWKCNLDYSEDKCKPQYSITRLDAAFKNSTVSTGFNFRFAKYFRSTDGTEYRTLHKAYAIRFEIIVSGNAGKFSAVPFLINFVTMITSVGLANDTVYPANLTLSHNPVDIIRCKATVFCDIILLNFHKGADQYKAKKFEEVSGVVTEAANGKVYKGSQMSFKALEKNLNDSGNFSIGQQEGVTRH